jgi:hypothetical protein
MSRTANYWANRIRKANPSAVVCQRQAKARRDGFDGRLRILVGHYRVAGYVTSNATLANDVRIHAPTNQRRLRRARRILDGMGVAYSRAHRAVVLGGVSRANLQGVIAELAKV